MCARRRTYFSCLAKKSRQKKATPLSVSPSLCYGATCDARGWGAAAELTARLQRSVQTTAASQITKRGHPSVSTRTPPAALLGTDRGGMDTGHRCARPGMPVRRIRALLAGGYGAPDRTSTHLNASQCTATHSPHVTKFHARDRVAWRGAARSARTSKAERSDGPCGSPTPFCMRLGRGVGGVAAAPKDADASCSSWPQLSERSAASAK